MLENWVAFENRWGLAKKGKHAVKEHVVQAKEHIKFLKEAKFFLCYPQLDAEARVFDDKYAQYLDADLTYLKSAAEKYLKNSFKNATDVKFQPKTTGANVNVFI